MAAIRIARDELRRMFPSARGNDAWIDALVILGPDLARKHGVTTLDHWRHFLAQVAAETDGLALRNMRENMNYSAGRIREVFDFRLRKAQAESPQFRGLSLAEIAGALAGNPDGLAESVYGGRKELGNVKPGDGAKYIGRGPLQTTGREWYAKLSSATGVDLVADPHRVEEPYVGWKAAFAEWEMLGCAALCARGVEAVSRRVNGGTNGMARRKAEYHRATVIWPDTEDAVDVSAEITPRHAETVPEPASVNSLASSGSRSMSWLQAARNWLSGAGLTLTGFFGLDSVSTFRNTIDELKSMASDHALLLIVLALGTALSLVLVVQHYLVIAANEGRYHPAGGEG